MAKTKSRTSSKRKSVVKKSTITRRQSKTSKLPLLLTVLAIIAFGSFYIYRKMITPLGINEVATPTFNCSQIAFSDNFTSSTIDNNKWFSYSETDGTATTNGQLTLTVPGNKTNGTAGIYSGGKVEAEGDFVHEVTLNSISITPSTSKAGSFTLGTGSTDWKNWYRIEIYANGDIQTHSTTNGVTTSAIPVNVYKNTPTKLKMVRMGTTLQTYYDVGNGYVLHTNQPNIYGGKVFTHLMGLSHTPDNPAVSMVVDDYSLGCIPPTPTGLTTTCSSDGNKVSLSWNAITNNSRYPLRFDDLSNNTSSCVDGWYCSNSTDRMIDDQNTTSQTIDITPNHEYKWWVHSYSNGVFSYPAVTTFKCNPKPATPTNPRSTCNPDGKSVRLMWDTVGDAQSYKVRVDDKAGKVTPYDGLSKGEYVATINPNQTYTWWAHSTKDGIDSAETSRLDFKCVPESTPTPTPKPTVKPTAKPTVTPTVAPTPTPTTPAYMIASPKPSSFAYENTATEPETEIATKSTNPLARFFTWLASLFE